MMRYDGGHRQKGFYAHDCRHYVAWSDCKKEEFSRDCWEALWAYYRNGGFEHVATYPIGLDLSSFDAKAPQSSKPDARATTSGAVGAAGRMEGTLAACVLLNQIYSVLTQEIVLESDRYEIAA